MEGIDPNPDNYVAGGILNTSTILVGCLVRLEPNKQTEVCLILCDVSNILWCALYFVLCLIVWCVGEPCE